MLRVETGTKKAPPMRYMNTSRAFLLAMIAMATSIAQAQIGTIGTGTSSSSLVMVMPNPFGQTMNVRFEKLDVRGRVTVAAVHVASGAKFVAHDVDPVSGVEMDATQFPTGNYLVEVIAPSSGQIIASIRASRSADLAALVGAGTQELPADRSLELDLDGGTTTNSHRIRLTPSPFNEYLKVGLDQVQVRGLVDVDLVDMRNGQVMLSRQVSPRVGVEFNTSDLQQGKYTVVVTETASGRVLGSVRADRVVPGTADMMIGTQATELQSDKSGDGENKAIMRNLFTAYPNPFNEHINVRFDTNKVQEMALINLRSSQSGKVVMKVQADPRNEIYIDTSSLPEGLYILEAQDLAQGYHIGAMQMKK
jgi:hypothetical protein